MSQTDMNVFCDVTAEEQIDALRRYFVSKNINIADKPVTNVNENLNELIKNLNSVYALEISGTDLEMVLNSLVSLIIISSDDNISKLVAAFCTSIVSAQLPENFLVIKLRVLSNLYHGLIATSKDRYTVYMSLAECSIQARSLQYLPTNLEVVKKCLATWKSEKPEIQSVYRLLFDALSNLTDSTSALKVATELLGTYTKENVASSAQDAQKVMLYCINDPNTFVFDSLLFQEPIKGLEKQPIHNLFTIFVSGTLSQYMDFYKANKSLFDQLGMNHEKNINKMRLLNLMSMGEQSKELPFDSLQEKLQIKPEDIESFIIDAIRTKCIRCKIDHLARTVTVMSVTNRTFTEQHWHTLKECLDKWKENLTLVNQNLTTLLSQPSPLAA